MDTTLKNKYVELTGLFNNTKDAREVYLNLRNNGYNDEEIKLLVLEGDLFKNSEKQVIVNKEGNSQKLSKMIGTITGIIVGVGLAAGLVFAGFDYAGLIGAGAAGIIGFIIGILMIPSASKEKLKLAEPKMADDGIIIGVNPKNKEDAMYVEDNWKTHKGKMVIVMR